ncbi:DUF6531 domain-containing protein, partial [Rhodanobacter sp. Si-c]
MDQGQIAVRTLAAMKEASPTAVYQLRLRRIDLSLAGRANKNPPHSDLFGCSTTRIFGLFFGAVLAFMCFVVSTPARAGEGTGQTQANAYAMCVAFLSTHPTYNQQPARCLFSPVADVQDNASCTSGLSSMASYFWGPSGGTDTTINWNWCVLAFNPDKNNGCSCNSQVGDPINLGTGNEYEGQEDYSTLTPLELRRYYNSNPSVVTTHIGANWRDNFDRSIEFPTGGYDFDATVFRPDGKKVQFIKMNNVWTADPDINDTLTENDNAQGQLQGWTYFDAVSRQLENYSVNGLLTSIQNPDGLTITLTYSDTSTPSSIAPIPGLLITVTGPHGQQLQFVYNLGSQVTQITLPDGDTLGYAYDTFGNLTQVTYPDGHTRIYKYDEGSNAPSGFPSLLTGIIDEDGQRYADIHYDSQGRSISSQLGGIANLTQVAYKSVGTTAVTYPLGAQTAIGFTVLYGRMQIISASQPCAPICSQIAARRTYDANGYPTSLTDFNGNITKTTYDANGLLDQQIDASGTPSQRTTNTTWNTTLHV